MTKLDFSVLCVRLLALHTLANSFQVLVYLVHFLFPGPTSVPPGLFPWLAAVSPFVLKVSFALFLWLFAAALGRSFIASGREHETISTWQTREVTTVAIGLLGVTLLISLISSVSTQIASHAAMTARGVTAVTPLIALVLPQVPALALGLGLLFGARFFSYWLSPRTLEIQPQSSSDAES
jgi:hypothetical protein